MIETMMEPEEALDIIKKFADLLDYAEKQHCQLCDLQERYNNIQQDLLHDIEFDDSDTTVNSSYAKLQAFKKMRQERRRVKDLLDSFFQIKTFAKDHRSLKATLFGLIKDLEKVEAEHKARVFVPRVLDDLSIANKHFSTPLIDLTSKFEEIEAIRQKRVEEYKKKK